MCKESRLRRNWRNFEKILKTSKKTGDAARFFTIYLTHSSRTFWFANWYGPWLVATGPFFQCAISN